MLHHLNQAKHSPDDANRWGEATCRLKYLRSPLLVFSLIIELQLHNLAEFVRFRAVNGEHEGFLQKRVLDFWKFAIERDDSFPAGFLGVVNETADCGFRVGFGTDKNRSESSNGEQNNRDRELQHDSAQRAAKDNHRGGRLQDLAQIAAFEQESSDNSSYRQKHAP